MKKYIVGVLCSLLLIIPSKVIAKKVTCSDGNFSANIEIDKEKLSLSEKAFISINSDYEYENIEYKLNNKDIVLVTKEGIVTPLKDGLVKITTIINFDNDHNCKVELPVEVLSHDSSLQTLNLDKLDLSGIFQKDKYDYDIKLPYSFDRVNIIAKTSSDTATVTGDGERYLNEGLNSYNIIVSASDGSKTSYKINITRLSASDDATLKNLIIEGFVLEPEFQKDIYQYELNVNKNYEKINIRAEANSELTKITGNGEKKLASGKNTFYIKVLAENGNEAKYSIIVNRNNGSSLLKNLVITNANLDRPFDKNEFIYTASVGSSVSSLDIKALVEENDQAEILGNENFQDGENEVIIRVTSNQDKTTTTYKIIVNKLSKKEEIAVIKNNILLMVLLIIFIISIIVMITFIAIFYKRNYRKKYRLKKHRKK